MQCVDTSLAAAGHAAALACNAAHPHCQHPQVLANAILFAVAAARAWATGTLSARCACCAARACCACCGPSAADEESQEEALVTDAVITVGGAPAQQKPPARV